MVGTASRTAWVPGATRNLKEAVSKVLARRKGNRIQVIHIQARGQWYPKPNNYPEGVDVEAAGTWGEGHAPSPGETPHLPFVILRIEVLEWKRRNH